MKDAAHSFAFFGELVEEGHGRFRFFDVIWDLVLLQEGFRFRAGMQHQIHPA